MMDIEILPMSITVLLIHLLSKEVIKMKKNYVCPEGEILEFDTKDVIVTSGILDSFRPEPANQDAGWTGLY